MHSAGENVWWHRPTDISIEDQIIADMQLEEDARYGKTYESRFSGNYAKPPKNAHLCEWCHQVMYSKQQNHKSCEIIKQRVRRARKV